MATARGALGVLFGGWGPPPQGLDQSDRLVQVQVIQFEAVPKNVLQPTINIHNKVHVLGLQDMEQAIIESLHWPTVAITKL